MTEDRIMRCPRCGCRIWRSTLEVMGCGTCRLLDARDAPKRHGR